MKKYIYALLAMALVSVSCSNDIDTEDGEVAKAYISLSELSLEDYPQNEDYWVISDADESITLDDDISMLNSILSAITLNTNREITLEFSELTEIPDNAFSEAAEALVCVVAPKVLTVGISAFEYAYGLEEVYLDNALTIDQCAFCGCMELKSLYLPKVVTINNSGVYFNPQLEDIYCPNLETVEGYGLSCNYILEKIDAPKLTTAEEHAFTDNYSLKSVNMQLLETLDGSAFENCYNLKSISLPELVTMNYSEFQYCYALESVSLPKIVDLGDDVFYYCTSLTEDGLDLPKVTTIGDGCFISTALSEAVFENVTEVGEEAFYKCRLLTSMKLPKVTELSYDVLSCCTALRELEVATFSGSSLTSIDEYAINEITTEWVTLTIGSVGGNVSINEKTLSDGTVFSRTFADIVVKNN